MEIRRQEKIGIILENQRLVATETQGKKILSEHAECNSPIFHWFFFLCLICVFLCLSVIIYLWV